MTQEQVAAMEAEVIALRAQIAKQANRKLTVKVSEKGGVSVYGLGRFPVTLYKQQWDKLIAFMPNITTFITENAAKLSVKE